MAMNRTMVTGTGQTATIGRRASRLLGSIVGARTDFEIRRALWGYAFAAPWLLGLLIFVGGPIIYSLFLSFTDYDILSPPRWTGLANYRRALFDDALFWPSLGRTFYFSLVYVPVSLVGSLALAMLVNQSIRGTRVFRTMFFLPHLTPQVALALIWIWLMNPQLGPLNLFLSRFGFPRDFPWYTDKSTVIPSLIIMSLWTGMGGNRMLIFLAGLQGVSQELYDAADIDGAGQWAKFLRITIPMITPAMFFNLILGIISALQVFTTAFVATKGGPSYASWFYALHIYQHAFRYFELGYGSALSWLFVVIVMSFTILNVSLSTRWVYYEGAV